MNLTLVSCKSDSNSMTVTVENKETGIVGQATISARSCGGPFLAQDANVKQLVSDLLVAINATGAEPVVEDAKAVEEVDDPLLAVSVAAKKPSLRVKL